MYILHLSFCGAGYHGWQMQPDVETFQLILRRALEEIFKTTDFTNPSGCSRTDQDVHAIEFIATVKAVHEIPPDNLRKGLNSVLPRSIRVRHVERVEGYADARTLVIGKHYRYLICETEVLSPFMYNLCWHSRYKLDLERMCACAPHFIGRHDFKSFQGSKSDVQTTDRTVRDVQVQRSGPFIIIDVVGDGFLKHQIRIMTGTMIAAAKGRIEPDDIPKIIAAKDRFEAGETLPGKGLYLYKLFRPGEDISAYKIPLFSPDFLLL